MESPYVKVDASKQRLSIEHKNMAYATVKVLSLIQVGRETDEITCMVEL